jgi:hypothetical protein
MIRNPRLRKSYVVMFTVGLWIEPPYHYLPSLSPSLAVASPLCPSKYQYQRRSSIQIQILVEIGWTWRRWWFRGVVLMSSLGLGSWEYRVVVGASWADMGRYLMYVRVISRIYTFLLFLSLLHEPTRTPSLQPVWESWYYQLCMLHVSTRLYLRLVIHLALVYSLYLRVGLL